MKKLGISLITAALVILFIAASPIVTVPIYNGVLQSDLNAGGYSITNLHGFVLTGSVFTNNIPYAVNTQLCNGGHGLGTVPSSVRWVIAFTNADSVGGYALGDEADLDSLVPDPLVLGGKIFSTWANSTSVGLSSGLSVTNPYIIPKAGGSSAVAEPTTNYVLKCYIKL